MKSINPIYALAICLLVFFNACQITEVDHRASTADLDLETMETIDRIIGKAPFISISESSHGLQAIHYVGTETFKYMVEVHGFRVFMLETFWAIEDQLAPFMESDRTDMNNLEGFYLNAFNSFEMKELLLWIREFNRENPADPVRLAGYQPEQPHSDAAMIKDLIQKAGLDIPESISGYFDSLPYTNGTINSDLEAVIYNWELRGQEKKVFSSGQCEYYLNGIEIILETIEYHSSLLGSELTEAEIKELDLSLRSLRSYLSLHVRDLDRSLFPEPGETIDMEELTNRFYHVGDSMRFEIFKVLMDTRYQGKKVCIWMHNWHAARQSGKVRGEGEGIPTLGAVSVGTRLFDEYGDDYRVIASVVGADTFNYERIGIHLEDVLLKDFPNDTILINLKDIQEEYQYLDLPNQPYSFVEQGALQVMSGYVFPEQFDGVFFIPGSGFTR